jgi:hypothetical protein
MHYNYYVKLAPYYLQQIIHMTVEYINIAQEDFELVSDYCLMPKCSICQLYDGENKLNLTKW